ncbi:MAG: hypothetical protein CK429_25120 [Mycobacterium sp.]|nr:MAG: hypothetical protein CK429_25120 [Mycobacterium sp.]
MGILGRIAARQRLRRATQESLSVPTFSAQLDCTPWVVGGLWPEELSPASAETAELAKYLNADLQRIARSANDDLRAVGCAGMEYTARRAAEARVIDEARSRAVRRVESTMRQLRERAQHPGAGSALMRAGRTADGEPAQVHSAARRATPAVDMDKTQVIPAVNDWHQEPQPDGADREAVAEDAVKRR